MARSRFAVFLAWVAAVAAVSLMAAGAATAGKSQGPIHAVICGNCDSGSYPPPHNCTPAHDVAVSWEGRVWFCYGGVWCYGGQPRRARAAGVIDPPPVVHRAEELTG